MQSSQQIEQAIRHVLATETLAIPLSEKLFSQGGLFSQLAATEQERRQIVQGALFQEAQRRFRELQRTESAEFAEAVRASAATRAADGYVAKWERADV